MYRIVLDEALPKTKQAHLIWLPIDKVAFCIALMCMFTFSSTWAENILTTIY